MHNSLICCNWLFLSLFRFILFYHWIFIVVYFSFGICSYCCVYCSSINNILSLVETSFTCVPINLLFASLAKDYDWEQVQQVARMGLKPRTAGLQVGCAEHSATLPPCKPRVYMSQTLNTAPLSLMLVVNFLYVVLTV